MNIAVKICGITRLEDAELAIELGAAALGFVFWPGSPRCIDVSAAAHLVARLPREVAAVGVFVDQPLDDVRRIAGDAGLSAVQLHGSESRAYCAAVGYRVIKTVTVTPAGLDPPEPAVDPAVTLLVDAHDPVRRGGTGRTVDWTIAAALAARRAIFLSGGLSPHNVAAAIAAVRPHGVDVSSGVEARPGVKDASRLRAFFDRVRSVDRTGAGTEAHG
jgi:phosphoribosylanthranilate isomerase